MGMLDAQPHPFAVTLPDFTVTLTDGTNWQPPADQKHSYSIDAGVLTVFPVNAAGQRQPGARHYSPTGWANLVEHDTPAIDPMHQQISGLVT